MPRPGALVIGPMKSGTTWVQDYLAWRGDVCLPRGVKETFFFDRYPERGALWYEGHFRHHDPARHDAIVEVAPSLLHCLEAPARVAAMLNPVVLIATPRDPVARAWSHYLHLRRKGYTAAPLERAMSEHPEIIAASHFDLHLARWRAALPKAELAVLPMELLAADPAAYALQLCTALGLPPRDPPANLGEANVGAVPPSFHLARLGRNAATALRAVGGYGAVNMAKQLGLKRVFFGADGQGKPVMTAQERALIETALIGATRPPPPHDRM